MLEHAVPVTGHQAARSSYHDDGVEGGVLVLLK
jgi:hypothetical protein